jgi:hypothetical protein
MNTCDACKHYTPSDLPYVWAKNCGVCELTDRSDSNNPGFYMADDAIAAACEGGGAWTYVGPKFGCIHWSKK